MLLDHGFSYDSSPLGHNATALPDIPVSRMYKGSLGAVYKMNEDLSFGVSYMYVDLGSMPIDYTSIGGRVKGRFDSNFYHTIGFSLRWKSGE